MKVGGLNCLLSLAHDDIFVFCKKGEGVGLDATATQHPTLFNNSPHHLEPSDHTAIFIERISNVQ